MNENKKEEIIPIFYDHTSLRGILTTWPPDDHVDPDGPQSIFTLAKNARLNKICFVSSNFEVFRDTLKLAKKLNIELVFGLQLWMVDDALNNHTEESLNQEHKIIIFAKNDNGYRQLGKIYTDCQTNQKNKYYKMRYDCKQLRNLWSNDLILTFPYVDSFLAKNHLTWGACIVPDFDFAPKEDWFFLKEVCSDLPFADLIDEAIDGINGQTLNVKTCYYEKAEDCRAMMINRTFQDKDAKFCNPANRWFCSDSFNFEKWKELIS